jgi:hypothetical protein
LRSASRCRCTRSRGDCAGSRSPAAQTALRRPRSHAVDGGANRESFLATNAAGATLVQGEGATGLGNFSGTFGPFRIGLTGSKAVQPDNTLIGSYAYVGETPPSASNTAEFFVYYNCTAKQVLFSCFGAYGSCPQTAQSAAVLTTSSVPALGPLALALTTLILGAAGGRCAAVPSSPVNRRRRR